MQSGESVNAATQPTQHRNAAERVKVSLSAHIEHPCNRRALHQYFMDGLARTVIYPAVANATVAKDWGAVARGEAVVARNAGCCCELTSGSWLESRSLVFKLSSLNNQSTMLVRETSELCTMH